MILLAYIHHKYIEESVAYHKCSVGVNCYDSDSDSDLDPSFW